MMRALFNALPGLRGEADPLDRSRRNVRTSVAAAVVLVVALTTAAAWMLARERSIALEIATSDATHLARQVASDAATLVLLGDKAAVDANRVAYFNTQSPALVAAELDTQAAMLPGVHSGAVINARGEIVATSGRFPGLDTAWLESLLLRHRDGWEDMIMAPAAEAGRPGMVAVSRSRWGDGRAFEGFAVILVNLSRLEEWLTDQDTVQDGTVDLLMADGTRVARLAGPPAAAQRDPRQFTALLGWEGEGPDLRSGQDAAGVQEAAAVLGIGLARDLPLVSVVEVRKEAVLSDWRRQRDMVLIINGILVLALLLMLSAYARGERRRGEAESGLRVSQERLAAALDNGNLGLWDWDVEADDIHFGAHLLTMLGYAHDALPHTVETYWSLIHPDDVPVVREALDAHVRGDTEVYATEHRLLTRDGGVAWVIDRGRAAERDEQGRALRMIGIKSDITALKDAQQSLQEKSRALEDSNRDLEQFAYIASHDLQEPLRMVSSYMTLLVRREGERLTPKGREYAGYAVDGAKRMTQLIRDLLEYSRIGTRGGALEPLDADTAVREAVDNLRIAAEDAGAAIHVATGMPDIVGDRGQIVRLVQNLVGNALKYRAPDRQPEIRVDWHHGPEEGMVTLSVSDNGIGIPPDQFDRIFQIFQRLHGTGEYEGTGIGLAVCRRIVERHGGSIRVEAEPRRGSVFRITLPTAHKAAARHRAAAE